MTNPKVSIIIPTYNGAYYLGETIQSVLAQTYPHWELILVDDCSSDQTVDVIKQFTDHRIRYILLEHNRGSSIARNTGLQASSGEIIIFLDQDDLFHPEKLQAHVEFLKDHHETGFTYNARFELNYSANTIRDIWRPPEYISLADLVLWFPIAPSDAVMRRKWAFQMNLLGGGLTWCGGEILRFGGLYLDGCKFARVNRALNYRRYHSGRIIKDLSGGCISEISAQDKIFADPRCPAEILVLHNVAHANLYQFWAYRAFTQEVTDLGQEFVRQAVHLKPSLLEDVPCELMNHFLINCIDDENQNHETLLGTILAQLPPEMAWLADQYEWASSQGYLLKGARAIIWDRPEDGRRYFQQAAKRGVRVDQSFLSSTAHQLVDYHEEFGAEATQEILHALIPYLETLGGATCARRLEGYYFVNLAFQHYYAGEPTDAHRMAIRAITKDPNYLKNRGVLAVLARSFLRF